MSQKMSKNTCYCRTGKLTSWRPGVANALLPRVLLASALVDTFLGFFFFLFFFFFLIASREVQRHCVYEGISGMNESIDLKYLSLTSNIF